MSSKAAPLLNEVSVSGFQNLNPAWQYRINHHDGRTLYFDPQPDGTWLVHVGIEGNFRLATEADGLVMLNEALEEGRTVEGARIFDGQKLIFKK